MHTFTNEMDAVMDIFAGCGGLGNACQELGKNYLGIENDEELAGACFQFLLRGIAWMEILTYLHSCSRCTNSHELTTVYFGVVTFWNYLLCLLLC